MDVRVCENCLNLSSYRVSIVLMHTQNQMN